MAAQTYTYTQAIKDMPNELRPRTRLAYAGPQALSSTELLSIIIGNGGKDQSAIRLAEQLLLQHQGLIGIAKTSFDELCQIHNVGPAKAAQIQACIELGKRLKATAPEDRPKLRTPADLANLVMLEMSLLENEELRLAALDNQDRLIKITTLYRGSLNMAVVRVCEIFREPIRINAKSLILFHNHPSGDPTPSPDDIRLTKIVVEAGKLMDIGVLDHLIIGRNRFVSLKERGLGF